MMLPIRTTANSATTIDGLRRQLRTNLGVVPFVGAGFSVPCGLPHWSDLLLSLAGEVGAAESVEEHLAAGRFEEAAGEVQQRLGRDSFSTRLNDILGESAIKNLCGPVLHVPALTRGPVLTTNLDNVLEQVFDNAGFPFTHIGQGPDVETVYRALHQDQPFLLKLHGGLGDSDTRVLTLGDYESAYGSREAVYTSRELPLPHLLEQIFTTRTLLFVGCSLFLDRTLTYMRRVKELHAAPARHFAILEDPGTTESRFDRETFLRELNISPIWFPRGRYELIGDLLDEVLDPQLRMTPDASSVDVPRPPFAGYLGVDLGTSYSSAAYSLDGKNVEFVRFAQAGGRTLIPSVVRFLDNLEYEIGEQTSPSKLSIVAEIRHFKRYLGTDKRYRVGRRHYTPAQVATLFLKRVRHAFAQQFGSPLPPTIVSAPANFGMRQVNDLIGAYHNAGFDVKRVVGEPCAAALNARELDLGDHFAVLVVEHRRRNDRYLRCRSRYCRQ